jgi:hypothetical protein
MKTFYLLILVIITCACSREEPSQNSLQGVWEYMEDTQLENVRGMSFFTDSHFAFVVNYQSKDSLDQHGVLAYSGTYVLEDSLVTATIQYAHDDALIGQELQWIHDTDGENASYQIISTDGEVVGSGRVRRLE